MAGLLYVDGGLVGVIEAKREDVSLIGAEQESDRYSAGLTTEIVPAVREIFGGGNEFRTKITYRSDDPEQALKDFRGDPLDRLSAAIVVASRLARAPARPGDGSLIVMGRCSARRIRRYGGAGNSPCGASGCRGCTSFSRTRKVHCGGPS
ncbi:MAG: hypothetical protein ACRDXB_01745 [Actinomycetes bacterium]